MFKKLLFILAIAGVGYTFLATAEKNKVEFDVVHAAQGSYDFALEQKNKDNAEVARLWSLYQQAEVNFKQTSSYLEVANRNLAHAKIQSGECLKNEDAYRKYDIIKARYL